MVSTNTVATKQKPQSQIPFSTISIYFVYFSNIKLMFLFFLKKSCLWHPWTALFQVGCTLELNVQLPTAFAAWRFYAFRNISMHWGSSWWQLIYVFNLSLYHTDHGKIEPRLSSVCTCISAWEKRKIKWFPFSFVQSLSQSACLR